MPDLDPLIPKHGGYRKLKSFQIAQLVYDVTVQFCERYVSKNSRTRDQMVQAARSGVQNIAEGSQASGTSRKTELKLTNVARASLEELRLDYEDFLRQRGEEVWEPDHPALTCFKAKRCASLDQVREWVREERALFWKNTDEHGPARTNTDEEEDDRSAAPTGKAASALVGRKPGSASAGEKPSSSADGKAVLAAGGEKPFSALAEEKPAPAPARPNASSPSVPVRVCPCSSVFAANAALSLLNLACYLLDRQLSALAASFEREGGFTERLYRTRNERRRRER